jgi:hypothetical protein
MNNKKNLASLAKKTKKPVETSVEGEKKRGRPAKSVTTKTIEDVVEKPQVVETSETKAMNKINNLLSDIDLIKPSKPKEKEIVDVVVEDNGVDWLGDELDRVTQENNELKVELKKTREALNMALNNGGGGNNASDVIVKKKVIELFTELQHNYMTLGSNLVINPPNFIARLVRFFPFLEEYRS